MQTKNNILFILHLPPPVHGAAMVGKWIQQSSTINNAFNIDYINLSTSESLQEIGKGGFQKIKNIVKIQKKVIGAITKKKYSLCYMTITAKGAGFYKDVLVVFVLKLFRKKIIYHFHNKGVKNNSTGFFNNMLYKFVFNNTKSILLSKHLYSDISKYVTENDVYYCPNGIENIEYNFSDNINKNAPCKFLFLSNMMEEKGVLILLEACDKLNKMNVNFECHFIGAWSDISESFFKKTVTNYNLSDKIFAHGKKYNKDKFEFFDNADIFVFPTYYHNETFGLVILEAMQAKLPVISTFEGGIPDVVLNEKTGILIENKDSTKLAEKLKLLIDHPEMRKEMGEAGRKHYEENFTLQKFEHTMISILKNVIDSYSVSSK